MWLLQRPTTSVNEPLRPLRLIHTTCFWCVRMRQTGAMQKIRTFSFCAAMHTSAAPARVKRTSCQWTFTNCLPLCRSWLRPPLCTRHGPSFWIDPSRASRNRRIEIGSRPTSPIPTWKSKPCEVWQMPATISSWNTIFHRKNGWRHLNMGQKMMESLKVKTVQRCNDRNIRQ